MRRVNRPMLHMLEANETALIWSPQFGFRLAQPDHDRCDELSLAETFLTVLSMQIEENMMRALTGDYLAKFKKH